MTFAQLANPEELTDFLNNHSDAAIVAFSATWCGPCKVAKPKLVQLAKTCPVPIGYVYEEDLEDFLDVFVKLSGFPTYILFQNGQEKARVQGTNWEELENMINNVQISGSS